MPTGVLLLDQSSAPSGDEVATIQGAGVSAGEVVQSMVALDGSARNVPPLTIDGARAQVVAKTYNTAGFVQTAKVIGIAQSATPVVRAEGSASVPDGFPSISSLGLTGLTIQVVTAQGTVLEAMPFSLSDSVTVKTTGPYIHEEVRRFRLFNSGGTTGVDREGWGCSMVVRRRSDLQTGIEVDIMFASCVFSEAENPYQPQNANPGTTYYREIRVSGIGASTLRGGPYEPSSMDAANDKLVAPVANSVHKLHVGNTLVRRFVVCTAATPATLTNRILQKADHGYATGEYSYYEQHAHGPQRMRLPEWPAGFTHGKESGSDAVDALAAEYLSDVSEPIVQGTATGGNGLFQQVSQGAWHPFGYANPFTPSGVLVQPQSGWLNRPDEGLAGCFELDHLMQRENAIYNASTGDWMSWVDSNAVSGQYLTVLGNEVNKTSGRPIFNGNPNDRNDFAWPHMLTAADALSMSADYHLAPTTRAWQSDAGLTRLSTQETMRAVNAPNYARHDGSHLVRFNRAARIAVWTMGDTMAIECLRARFGWLSTQQSNGNNAPSVVSGANDFSAGLYNFQLGLSLMLENNHGEGSGVESDGVGRMGGYGAFDRRMGHILDQIGMYAAVCDSGDRAIHQAYFDNAASHALRAASPQGFFGRQDDRRTFLNGGQSPYPEDPANYGPTDLINETGSLNGSVTIPEQESQFTYEFHQQFILNGLVSLARSGCSAVLAEGIFDALEAHTNAIFGARPGTQGAPNYYGVLSKTEGLPTTGAPAPAGLPLAWDFTAGNNNVTAREWVGMTLAYLFVVRPASLAAWRDYSVQFLSNNSGLNYTNDNDLRNRLLTEINGNTSGKDQHGTLTLGFLTYLFGQTSA